MGPRIVVMGASLGGFRALTEILGGLSGAFPLPVAIVQHQSENVGSDLVRLLRPYAALRISEPEDKEPIVPGRIYLAPVGYHLLVDTFGFSLSTDSPVHYARPSIDVLFESAADTYLEGAIGVALTASSADGAQGLATIKQRGGVAVVQDPSTAESRVLPDAVLAATGVDRVLPLAAIAPYLEACARTPRGALRVP